MSPTSRQPGNGMATSQRPAAVWGSPATPDACAAGVTCWPCDSPLAQQQQHHHHHHHQEGSFHLSHPAAQHTAVADGCLPHQQPHQQQQQQQLQEGRQARQQCRSPRAAARQGACLLHKRLQRLASHKGHHVASLLVMTQVLRLLLALSTGCPTAALLSESQLRAQLLKELRAAAAAARAEGDRVTSLSLLKHLPAPRLAALRAAARKHPRGTNSRLLCGNSSAHPGCSNSSGSSSGSESDNDSDPSTSSGGMQLLAGGFFASSAAAAAGGLASAAVPAFLPPSVWLPQQQQQPQTLPLPQLAPQHLQQLLTPPAVLLQQQWPQQHPLQLLLPAVLPVPLQQQQQQRQRQRQQAGFDVGCLLETTLVAAAAEAQLNSISLDGPDSSCLTDDASSPVDIESVMQEELELAKSDGIF